MFPKSLLVITLGALALAEPNAWARPLASSNPWTVLSNHSPNTKALDAWIRPDSGQALRLELEALRGTLAGAPMELTAEAKGSPLILGIPDPTGRLQRFAVWESPILASGLASKFPAIRTYTGRGLDRPTDVLRADVTYQGFHAFVHSTDGDWFVDPYSRGDSAHYTSYYGRDLGPIKPWECGADNLGGTGPALRHTSRPSSLLPVTLRKYRVAVAATGEYTYYVSHPEPPSVALALSAITTGIARVSLLYETELAIRFELAANNDAIIFTTSDDPYTYPVTAEDVSGESGSLFSQNGPVCESVIGTNNYDLCMVVYQSSLFRGVSFHGSVCDEARKEKIAAGQPDPTGDAFWVNMVSHEIGHAFNARHTFNATSGSCGGARWNETAYEIGSGSTLMAYAGLCPQDSYTGNLPDFYFHADSLLSIESFALNASGFGCGTPVPEFSNSPPIVTVGMGQGIPHGTPFTVTAAATDPDGDPLTFSWEQLDLGPPTSLVAQDNGASPINRSYPPSVSHTRQVPAAPDLVSGLVLDEDKLPMVFRPHYHWIVTVRDGRGGNTSLPLTLSVLESLGPFRVTSQTSGTLWRVGTTQTVTWDVAQTNGLSESVAILLSLDGGYTFPIVVLASTPNDGEATITVPPAPTFNGRIKVQAIGNIFFNINHGAIIVEGMLSASANAGRSIGTVGGEGVSDYDAVVSGVASAEVTASWVTDPDPWGECAPGAHFGESSAEAALGVLKASARCSHRLPVYVPNPDFSPFCPGHPFDATSANGSATAFDEVYVAAPPYQSKVPLLYRVRGSASIHVQPDFGVPPEFTSTGYAYSAASYRFRQGASLGLNAELLGTHWLTPAGQIIAQPMPTEAFGKLPLSTGVPLTTNMMLLANARCTNAGGFADAGHTAYFELWSPDPNVVLTTASGHSYAPEPCSPGPMIVQHPTAASACSASPVTFSVGASGGGPTLYGWQFQAANGLYLPLFDGSNRDPFNGRTLFVSGADSATLMVLNAVGPPTPVNLRGQAYNVCGTSSSDPASFTLLQAQPPTILAQPADASTCAGTAASFFANIVGTPPIGYQWQAELEAGTFTDLSDGSLEHAGVVLGSVSGATTATLQFNPSAQFTLQRPSLALRCRATNVCAPSFTNAVMLLVGGAQGMPVVLVDEPGPGISRVYWSPIPGANGYDVLRGSLTLLRGSGGDFSASTQACLGNDLAGSFVDDPSPVSPGQGHWYLMRAAGCGGGGSYDTGGVTERVSRRRDHCVCRGVSMRIAHGRGGATVSVPDLTGSPSNRLYWSGRGIRGKRVCDAEASGRRRSTVNASLATLRLGGTR